MIEAQLPSLQEIYDFSSSDLQKIVGDIQQKMAKNAISQQQHQRYEEYIENIRIELQQRKTLQFFQELCAVDNPYIKKVTDFNNQFLKLAEEAIAAQEHPAKPFQKKLLPEIHEQQIYQNDAQIDSRSVTSAIADKSRLTDNKSYQSTNAYQQKTYTAASEKRSSADEKRTNFGMIKTKNNKNSMKDFIMSTLNKNKAEGTYVVKKSGGPSKPQPTYTVNERGHLVSANTLEPISMKSIKSNSTAKQKSQISANSTSNKQIVEKANKPNQAQLEKKKLEAIQKVKHVKPEKKKQKALNNKDLLEMIREEEKEKQRKQRKKQQERHSNVQNKSDSQKQNKAKVEETKKQSIIENKGTNNRQIQSPQQFVLPVITQKDQQKMEQIRQIIEAQDDSKQKSTHNSTQQIKEQIKNQQILQNIPLDQIGNKKSIKNIKIQSQQQSKQTTQIVQKTRKSQAIKQLDSRNHNIQQFMATPNRQQQKLKTTANKFKDEMDELTKINQQLRSETHKIAYNKKDQEQNAQSNISKRIQNTKSEQFGRIIDITEQQYKTQQVNTSDAQQPINKKCYNEEYWIHIREQAESQIKRFKVQKELQQISRRSIKNNIDKSISTKSQDSKRQDSSQQGDTTQNPSTNQLRQSQASEEDKFIDKRKMQLAKMINDHNKRVIPKKPPLPIISPPKPMYALPNFNYLQVYPTFNHIFSVMYTKAEHQALQDIPMIMRDLTNMFTTHMHHFKDQNSYFKPAIFLPFDSTNNFQLSDPKQLLLHAQNTYVNLKKIVERLEIFNGNLSGQFNQADNRYYRVVKTKQEVYDIISTGFLRRKGWKQLPHGCSLRSSWNLFWSWSKPDIDVSKLLVWQRINHFPFNKNLSRKDLLYKNLDSFRKMLKIPFNFLPLTFNLPKQFTQFSIKFHEQEIVNRDLNYWIMKPIGKSRGRGIKVINNLAELNYTDNIIVQKYITNPLLLDGYKFDMRIYVLVTNFHPLEAFVYKEGFARLSTEKFSLQPMFIKNTFVHLTNFAINKNNEQAKQTAAFSGGSKISLKVLKDKITKMGYSFNNIWSQVHQIIIKSLLGCSISVPPFPTAFELFGYDIMIDTDGSCHLIQINASPSLQRSYLIDEIVKQSLIDDILDIVDPPNFDKEQLLDIMAERLGGKKKITPEEDLIAIARILKYKPVRKLGQVPENIGLFQMIAPSKLSTDLQKQIKGRSGANNPKNID